MTIIHVLRFGGLAFGDQLVNFCSAGSLSGLCDSVNLV